MNKISYTVLCSRIWKVMIVWFFCRSEIFGRFYLDSIELMLVMFEFVNGVKAVETEWAAVLGKTLCPIFYRKMPQRLAKRLSAGFQIKESQPQVHFSI